MPLGVHQRFFDHLVHVCTFFIQEIRGEYLLSQSERLSVCYLSVEKFLFVFSPEAI